MVGVLAAVLVAVCVTDLPQVQPIVGVEGAVCFVAGLSSGCQS